MAMVGRGSGAGSASLVLTLKPAPFHNSSLSAEFACSSRSLSSETNQQIPEVLPRRAHLRSFSCSLLPVRTELCLRARDEVGRRLPSCSQLPLQTMPSPKKRAVCAPPPGLRPHGLLWLLSQCHRFLDTADHTSVARIDGRPGTSLDGSRHVQLLPFPRTFFPVSLPLAAQSGTSSHQASAQCHNGHPGHRRVHL